MARVAPVLTCTAEERTTLTQFGPNRSEEARLVGCARIFLLCLDGKRNEEVARELWVRSSTVGVRRQRCAEQGLRDRHRSGRPSWRGAPDPDSDPAFATASPCRTQLCPGPPGENGWNLSGGR